MELVQYITDAPGVYDLKGDTENTLTATDKVGRTTKNRDLPCNHEPFLSHIGYEPL